MELSNTAIYILCSAGLYLLAAAAAVIFYKNEKTANLIPNIICMTASAAGVLASLLQIGWNSGTQTLITFESPVPNIYFNFKFDNTSAFFILALSILVFSVSLYSIGYLKHYYGQRNIGLFNFLYSTFILSILLVFTASNMISFLLAWEAMSLISYFLVVFESDNKESRRAGSLYIIMTHIGTAFIIAAFVLFYCYTGTFDIGTGGGALPGNVRDICFILLLIGFGTKAGIIPLHIWLPYAHPAASSNVSALMSGIMIKTAVYGLIRFLFAYMGIKSMWWGLVILILGALSCFLGVAYASVVTNIKKVLAFSSIENIGIILIGLGVSMLAKASGNEILSALGLIAVLLHTANHSLFKGGLFMGAGSVQYSTHTKNMEELGGLIKKMPYTSVMVLCFSLAISAVVPLNGFISEWFTYQSLFINISSGSAVVMTLSILCAAVLAISGAMALSCFVRLYGTTFLGKPRTVHAEEAKEVPAVMWVGMGILGLLCILAGLFPYELVRLADKVTASINGVSIINDLKGSFLFMYYPAEFKASSSSPLTMVLLAGAAVILVMFLARLIGGRLKVRKYGTWDCGYERLTPRMQYTATGFSKPLRIVFRMLFRPVRELQVKEGTSPYHPDSMTYRVSTEKIFEKYMYYPILDFMKGTSKKLKFSIQTGSIHMYLLYIFVAVIALMLYVSFF